MITTEHPKPKGSNVVPFRVCYGFSVRDRNILPKKELHRRAWVNPKPQTLISWMYRKVSSPDQPSSHDKGNIRDYRGYMGASRGYIGVRLG